MPDIGLPPASVATVGKDGQIRFGRYAGETGPIDWTRAGPGRLWRVLHRKRWQYASIIGDDHVVDLEVQPEGVRSQDKNLGFAVSRFIQPIGTYRGTVLGRDVGRLSGVLEDHVARW